MDSRKVFSRRGKDHRMSARRAGDMEGDYAGAGRHRSRGGTDLTFALLLPASCLLLAHGVLATTVCILSTDVGNEIDGKWVVVYALTNPQVEVLGVVAAHALTGNPLRRTPLTVSSIEGRLGYQVY